MLAAIAPLPEDVPELLLASLLLGERLPRVDGAGPAPARRAGRVRDRGRASKAGERRVEGPFGDHFGYNSLAHDYPVFHVEKVFRRKDAIFPATVVGRPRQEDFCIGDYLQDLLSPLFPLVMPAVQRPLGLRRDRASTASRPRASSPSATRARRSRRGLRILGEGQLSLTKCLIVVDDRRRGRARREGPARPRARAPRLAQRLHRARRDGAGHARLHGPEGQPRQQGPVPRDGRPRSARSRRSFSGTLPEGVRRAAVFCPGRWSSKASPTPTEPGLATRIAGHASFADWPLLVLVDDAAEATRSTELFLWTAFTRMEPAADLHGRERVTARFHTGLVAPVVLDARMKPWYPEVMAVDAPTRDLVDRRWSEYGIP